jgi:class 3 adenylate cyclase/tetratricopeptide (TPR) repeat protein
MSSVACGSCGNPVAAGAKFCSECGTSRALTCPSCGSTHAPGAKFCTECGAQISGASPAEAPSTLPPAAQAERRLVTVLFADLVGFTTLSEGRDAEDTRELLTRYFDTSRRVIGRYGGTVEKFIGDAVMAVWGTPVAQEDDAERAVRAALDLVEAVAGLAGEAAPGLNARAGVLTGEAAVTLGAEGQGMVAGDLVNTAARIQSAAEPGSVLVGETTKRATDAALVYEDAGAHELKGKAETVQLWRAARVVSGRRGEGRSTGLEAPFVGRGRELRLVRDLFHAAADDSRATLVSVVGVAGIGKSRLAWELEKHIDGLAVDVWWHRGRCLSYGDGVAYWALAEMVRGRAGILEDEDESAALAKLQACVAEHVTDATEREWVEPRLQHLLGLIERTASDRDDLYSAWRAFFERLADKGAVVLVFDDLHWADAGLVEFVEHLLEWARGKPIYVLALSRPEVAERHPAFGSRVRSATTLMLDPLTDEAMGELLVGLVPGLPDDTRAMIRDRADGIPLYAVETVRMLLDRGLLEREGDTYAVTGSLDALAVPETLHGLIAARLDGLDDDERHLLERAAVLGKTFSARGLAALGAGDVADVGCMLNALVRKEVLSIDTDPRSPERGQFGFLQALVQRVAYETLARGDRRALHLAAASYLSSEAGIDPDEIAEVIATHYRDAYDADPAASDADDARAHAREWLCRAGERAASLAAPEDARRAFDDAVSLAHEPLERARLLERAGELGIDASEHELAVERLEAARLLYEETMRPHDAARATAGLSVAYWNLGRIDEATALVEPAFAVLSTDEPDADLAMLAAECARIHHFRGDNALAMERVEFALEIAETHELPEVLSHALNTKALLLRSRPHEARALMREALDIALEHDLVTAALRAYNNLAVLLMSTDRQDELRRVETDGFELALRRGNRVFFVAFGGARTTTLLSEGDWDAAFSLAADWLPTEPTSQSGEVVSVLFFVEATLQRRGDDEARRLLDLVAPGIESSSDTQLQMNVAFKAQLVATLEGRPSGVLKAIRELVPLLLESDFGEPAAFALGIALDVLYDDGDPAPLLPLVDLVEAVPLPLRTRGLVADTARVRGAVASLAGDHDAAVDHFATGLAAARNLGDGYPLARVLADYGRALVRAGRTEEAEPLLVEARQLFEKMRAVVWLERIDAVLPSGLAAQT